MGFSRGCSIHIMGGDIVKLLTLQYNKVNTMSIVLTRKGVHMISYLKSIILTSPDKLISYADFISAALYHPELGYYMKDKQKIGREGDFITTSNISDLYGKLMSRWFAYVCKTQNIPPVFCEIGAGNGRFAYAFLKEWDQTSNLPIEYIIIESSPYHRKLQYDLLSHEYSFVQAETLEELDSFDGVVFSNELFDALPVHVVEKEKGEIVEVMVGIKDDKLFEEKVPLSNQAILSFIQESKLKLKEKQRIEVPLAMEIMLKDISRALRKGLVLTADYGYTNEDWKEPLRSQGSLRGYYQHKMVDNVLENPGEIDITTHIHFDYLIQKGNDLGLNFITKLRQDEFLLKTGILQELTNHYDPNPFSEVSKRNRAVRSLIMPGGISSYFNIVIQQKGLELREDQLFET
jgi:SAM-dependent MidA family methyltransferase